MTEPWGHKLTITIYVEGDIREVGDSLFQASDAACDALEKGGATLDGAGVSVEAVEKRPIESGGI